MTNSSEEALTPQSELHASRQAVLDAMSLYNEHTTALGRALEWAMEFVEEPEYFPGDGDRQYWNEKRDSIYGLIRAMKATQGGAVHAPGVSVES